MGDFNVSDTVGSAKPHSVAGDNLVSFIGQSHHYQGSGRFRLEAELRTNI
jgi:hypothetical protein